MEAKDVIRLPDPRRHVRAEVREVVRDVDGRPHAFLRIRLTGRYFPAGANEYFLLIGDVVSRFTRIAPDGLSLSAYFDRPLPPSNVITLGYGRVVMADFDLPIDTREIVRLDRRRLPEGTVDYLR